MKYSLFGDPDRTETTPGALAAKGHLDH